jgi:serralysin
MGGIANVHYPITTAFGVAPAPSFAPDWAWGDTWYNHNAYNDPRRGNFAYAAGIMHETGHALGLKHGHMTQLEHGILFPALPTDHDSSEYSVMTYRRYVGDDPQGFLAPDYPTTWMQNDIAALQYYYGANFAHNRGNTRYSWSPTTGEMFVNGHGRDAPVANRIFMTIWDGGGIDTYDLSNYRTNVRIDLQPGEWTTTSAAQLANLGDGHFARGNIANALLYRGNTASMIENALGGSGNDSLTGNMKGNQLSGGAGADRLFGLGGNDNLLGGLGNDILVSGPGRDRLSGGAGSDTYIVDTAADIVIETGAGTDTVVATLSYALAASAPVEHLVILDRAGRAGIDLTGSSAANAVVGNQGGNVLRGRGGHDTLGGFGGNDLLDGGPGNDLLIGGRGRDNLVGGLGRDRFDFNFANESVRGRLHDTVDFHRAEGDRIDLSGIDADSDGNAGNQAFRFIGAHAFTGVDGQLRFSGGLLQGDTNGDRVADIEIRIVGALVRGDIIL